jgi:hypothetical protein
MQQNLNTEQYKVESWWNKLTKIQQRKLLQATEHLKNSKYFTSGYEQRRKIYLMRDQYLHLLDLSLKTKEILKVVENYTKDEKIELVHSLLDSVTDYSWSVSYDSNKDSKLKRTKVEIA